MTIPSLALSRLLVAYMLVTGNPASVWNDVGKVDFWALSKPTKMIAVNMEIIDRYEGAYILMWAHNFDSDIELIRRRYHELKGVPRVIDLERFPSRDHAQACLTFNREYGKHLEWQLYAVKAHQKGLVREIMRENTQLHDIWQHIYHAHNYCYVYDKRIELKRLMKVLGKADYYAGKLPPHVPIWRFRTIE